MGIIEYVNQFRIKYMDYLFFTKNEEWESEREYRVVYLSNKIENEYFTINNSLKSINLGIDFNDGYLPSIKAYCKNIPIYKMDFTDVRLTQHIVNL